MLTRQKMRKRFQKFSDRMDRKQRKLHEKKIPLAGITKKG